MTTTLQSAIWNARNLLAISFFLWILSTVSFAQKPDYTVGKMIITFTDIRSDIGNIALGLYNDDSQWFDDPISEYKWDKSKLTNGKLTIEIPNLKRGRYACAVLDDENENLEMDYFIGLPKEGWGMSMNPSFLKLKKPDFDEVAFDLDAPVVRFEIKLNYLNKNKKVKEN